MSADKVVYLDSSAIVKLVVKEPETVALRRFLRRRQTLVSSALAGAEVLPAVMLHGKKASKTAEAVLGRFELLRINHRILRTAGSLPPAGLRTLDAHSPGKCPDAPGQLDPHGLLPRSTHRCLRSLRADNSGP